MSNSVCPQQLDAYQQQRVKQYLKQKKQEREIKLTLASGAAGGVIGAGFAFFQRGDSFSKLTTGQKFSYFGKHAAVTAAMFASVHVILNLMNRLFLRE